MTAESRSVVVRLSMEAAQYIRDAQKVGTVTADAMSKVEKSTMSASQAQDKLADGAGKVGIAAAVGVGAVVTATANFDQAMSKVQAATHETTSGMQNLRQAALDAGADTAFSASEAAGGIEALAKAGLETQEILDGGLTGALDLAAAGEMQVADAAEAAAGALAQFKLDGDQAAHVADLLAAGAGKAQGDVSDMVLALKQAGTVSAQTGLSLEETVGALSAMAEQSLLGSDAGTSFKTMLASLTPNSEAAADAMAQYNIHAFDAQGNFVGMTALAGQLRDGLSGLTDEQRAMALETIFGSDAVRAASIIYDNGAEGIANWTAKVNDAGFAAETASIKQDNLRGDLEKLGGAFETALIGSGEGSQGFLRQVTQGLTSVIDKYSELPPSAQSATSAIMAGAAAVGGSIWVGSKLVQGIASTREAFDSLETSGSRAGKVIKGIGTASAVASGVLILAGALTELSNSAAESLPGMEALEGRLIGIANAGEGFSISLGPEFDSLGASLDRLADPSRVQKLSDWTNSVNDALFPGKQYADSSSREALQEVEALDAALASLASSGNSEVAAASLERVLSTLSDPQADALLGLLPQYDEAMAGVANDAELAANAQHDVADATSAVGSAMRAAAPMTKAQAEALKDARDQASDTARDFVGLGDSLDDAKVSLGDWISEMAENAAALENFTANAKKAAKNGLREGLIQELENAGTAGALRMKQLANATDEEIARANKAWARGQKAIDDYVDAVVKVPGEKSTTLNLKAMDAIADLIAFRNRLDEATKDRIFSITTVYKTVRSASDALPDRTPRKAGGGQILGPGTTTSDSIPVWLSNKEYVIKAAAVDHYGVGFFDDANAMRLAGGGSVDKAQQRDAAARRAREERERREEEQRQRRLDAQRAKDLLASDLRDEEEQQRLELLDARRRLRSARKAGRPMSEIREAQLALQQEKADRDDMAARVAQEAADEEARRQKEHDDAVLEGQTRAWDMAKDAAKAQVDAAQQMVDTVKANMERLGDAAVAGFDSPLFSKSQSGLWTGGGMAGGGWRAALTNDISGLRERSSIITSLSNPSLGLSPQALEALLGQASNQQIQEMLAAGEVDDYAALFAERARLTGAVRGQAGVAGYGGEWAAANAQFTAMNQKLDLLNTLIAGARPINVTETVSAAALAAEMARLQAATGGF
ncbi:MAG TPA: phage tail tape measure protein [Nocardioides sp.]|uniref:phage tail tape measure protein n=1 Tax=Nocardioides sp. TaxID=35761 RepID=UPI002ED9F2FC